MKIKNAYRLIKEKYELVSSKENLTSYDFYYNMPCIMLKDSLEVFSIIGDDNLTKISGVKEENIICSLFRKIHTNFFNEDIVY